MSVRLQWWGANLYHWVEKLTKDITLQEPAPCITFLYYSADYADAGNGLAFCRIFRAETDGITVHHEFFRLPKSSRGKGIAREIFRPSIQEYVNMGAKTIHVHAALQDGGYVWARNFFTATSKSEVTAIKRSTKQVTCRPVQGCQKANISLHFPFKNISTSFPICLMMAALKDIAQIVSPSPNLQIRVTVL